MHFRPISQYLVKRNLSKSVLKHQSRTAGIIIIGDEILKGEVTDTNSTYLVKQLYQLGVRVRKISVVSDDIKQISEEVRSFSDNYTYVITSGGIGPTHDDVTFEAIGYAFREPLIAHPILVDICSKYYGTKDLDSPGMKLAHIPKGAKLMFGEAKTSYPNISVKNVYIFPGIPQLLRKLFEQIGHKIFTSHEKFYTKAIYFNVTEKLIVDVLNILVKKFPTVIFGSYPELENSQYKVKITMECTNEEKLQIAYNTMINMMPSEYIVNA
ncbi:FAD synthase-like [Onthophagus taurus]|uniref:FAD synthase-like n=1 Tax=Onthophagus taurus TaxID=166361 RepID=UPI000C20557F|nr:FAD synthase-like [Onthophagus taurus]